MNTYALVALSLGSLLGLIFVFNHKFNIYTLFVSALLVIGPVTYYFPSMGIVQWIPTVLSGMIYVKCLLILIKYGFVNAKRCFPRFAYPMMFFILSCVVSTAINMNFVESIYASKNVFQFWSLPLLFLLISIDFSFVRRICYLLLFFALIQSPLGVVQYIQKGGQFPGDAVTGTFGGSSVTGTGPNAVLSIFLLSQIGVCLMLAFKKHLNWFIAFLLIVVLSLPIVLANAKAIVIFVVAMTVVIFNSLGKARFSSTIVLFLLVAVLGGGFMYAHFLESSKYTSKVHENADFEDYAERSLAYSVGDNVIQLNRLTALKFWLSENSYFKRPVRFWVGHGVGSSRSSGLQLGHLLFKRYKYYFLDVTGLSRLLWDVGLLGSIAYLLIFVLAYREASALKHLVSDNSIDYVFLTSLQISSLFILLEIPYKGTHFMNTSYSFYVMLVLALIVGFKVALQPSVANGDN